ncbi:MAG: hypothetical protein ACMUIU_19915 [bacterium]
MVQQKLFSFNTIERGNQEVSPRGGLIVFDGFLKAIKTEETIRRYMPLPGSNRGYEAWRYIEPLILMQYGGGRNISDLKKLREDKVLQKATGMRGISFFRRQGMLYSGFNQFFKTKGSAFTIVADQDAAVKETINAIQIF